MHIGSMVTILGVGGLDSSFNIMRFINKNMLVIENVDFSLMNEFMYKYMLPHKYYIAFNVFLFFRSASMPFSFKNIICNNCSLHEK